jgi:hypothetical protein
MSGKQRSQFHRVAIESGDRVTGSFADSLVSRDAESNADAD